MSNQTSKVPSIPDFARGGTGEAPLSQIADTIMLPFENYEIVVGVSRDGRIVRVVEVRMKKDFRSLKQRLASTGNFDVDRFYLEDDRKE